MIFISSACVKADTIKDAVKTLCDAGFTRIELSGGTHYYDDYAADLIDLQKRYGLTYICHNYFPPAPQPFVLNLASLDDKVFERTYKHLEMLIDFSRQVQAPRAGFHAGFFLDMDAHEVGDRLRRRDLYAREACIERFCEAVKRLVQCAGDVELYVENNVVSQGNLESFCGENMFMLTSYDDVVELQKRIDYKLLLDVAHLQVSARSLGLDFASQLKALMPLSDYVHCSDNDGLSDQNRPLARDSLLFRSLQGYCLRDKTVTLEIYDTIDALKNSYALLRELETP